MDTSQHKISDLSPHLFWDVDRSKLEWNKNRSTIIHKVLEYGLLEDWLIVKSVYSKEEIQKVAINFRSLKPKSLAFISTYLDLLKTEFRCYTQKHLLLKHWIY